MQLWAGCFNIKELTSGETMDDMLIDVYIGVNPKIMMI